MTDQEMIAAIKKIYEYKKQIAQINENRRVQEIALNTVYKVAECNQAKSDLALNSQQQINDIYAQIKLLEDALGEKTV